MKINPFYDPRAARVEELIGMLDGSEFYIDRAHHPNIQDMIEYKSELRDLIISLRERYGEDYYVLEYKTYCNHLANRNQQ